MRINRTDHERLIFIICKECFQILFSNVGIDTSRRQMHIVGGYTMVVTDFGYTINFQMSCILVHKFIGSLSSFTCGFLDGFIGFVDNLRLYRYMTRIYRYHEMGS